MWVYAIAIACGGSPAAVPHRAAYLGRPLDLDVTTLSAHQISTVIPYGLGPELATPARRAVLAGWFAELRARRIRVIAPIAGSTRLRELRLLLHEHPNVELDGLVTELEYWNRSDREAAFEELLALVREMRAMRVPRIGVYLGYPTAAETARLAPRIDFVFLNYSVRDPAAAYTHRHPRGGALRDRLQRFAGRVAIWPIFYARGEVEMGEALRTRGLAAAEARFTAELAADPEVTGGGVAGFVYFTLDALSVR